MIFPLGVPLERSSPSFFTQGSNHIYASNFQLRLHGNFTSAETSTSSSSSSCKVKKSSRKPSPPLTGYSFAFQPFHPSPFTNRGEERNLFLARLMIYRWIRNEKLPKCVIFDVMHVPSFSRSLLVFFSFLISSLLFFFSLNVATRFPRYSPL